MSQISTNGINNNYPTPGVNNSTQGFRDNFTQITTQLNTAATEITDLQTKVVVKAALNNTSLNNDMANTLISNASTQGFRATSYNLGNALAGTVLVNVNQADVQYGAITGNTVIQFGNWSPTNTESNVILRLTVSTANATIQLPTACVSNTGRNFGTTLLENYANVGGYPTLTAPANTTLLEYKFSSLDCGNTILVEPLNRPFQSTEVQQRTPAPTGLQGDTAGTVAVDANYIYVCTGSYNSTAYAVTATNTYATGNLITLSSTTNLANNAPIVFTGNVFGGLAANTVYYVLSNAAAPNITVSATRTSGSAGSVFALSTANGAATATYYIGSNIWTRIPLQTW